MHCVRTFGRTKVNGLSVGVLANLARVVYWARPFDNPLRQAQDAVRANGLGASSGGLLGCVYRGAARSSWMVRREEATIVGLVWR